jgi:hypothetical protein
MIASLVNVASIGDANNRDSPRRPIDREHNAPIPGANPKSSLQFSRERFHPADGWIARQALKHILNPRLHGRRKRVKSGLGFHRNPHLKHFGIMTKNVVESRANLP